MTAREPSPAERVRTVLAGTTVAVLLTRGCPATRRMTSVSVRVGPDGHPDMWLNEGSPVLPLLGGGRVVSLVLPAFAPFRRLEISGPLVHRRADCAGRRGYRMSPLSVRLVGRTSLSIPLPDFTAAEPDPLSCAADSALRHLEHAHSRELLACVHAHGFHDAVAVVPQYLDRYGITFAALGRDGVRSLRLSFPNGPVDRLEDVGLGLRVQLTCRCGPGSA